MHELSLALEILGIVERTAQQNGAGAVKDIYIEVGSLAGVLIPSLEFCLEAVKRDTCAREANIHILGVQGQGECPLCGNGYPMDLPLTLCPGCGEGYLRMTAGDDLRVKEIEVEARA